MEKASRLANAAVYDYGVLYPDGKERMEFGRIHRRRLKRKNAVGNPSILMCS